jgi:phenylpyruvate tautomerase PptA (4-oxalocrotonate tautomerase family)
MPISHISLLRGKSSAYLRAVSDSLHQALVEAFDVPPEDRFQVMHQHGAEEMSIDPHYLSGTRSADFVLFNITAGRPRSAATKQAFYRRLVELLGQSPGLRPDDVMIVVQTTQPEDWSFSGGTQFISAERIPSQPGSRP